MIVTRDESKMERFRLTNVWLGLGRMIQQSDERLVPKSCYRVEKSIDPHSARNTMCLRLSIFNLLLCASSSFVIRVPKFTTAPSFHKILVSRIRKGRAHSFLAVEPVLSCSYDSQMNKFACCFGN